MDGVFELKKNDFFLQKTYNGKLEFFTTGWPFSSGKTILFEFRWFLSPAKIVHLHGCPNCSQIVFWAVFFLGSVVIFAFFFFFSESEFTTDLQRIFMNLQRKFPNLQRIVLSARLIWLGSHRCFSVLANIRVTLRHPRVFFFTWRV